MNILIDTLNQIPNKIIPKFNLAEVITSPMWESDEFNRGWREMTSFEADNREVLYQSICGGIRLN